MAGKGSNRRPGITGTTRRNIRRKSTVAKVAQEEEEWKERRRKRKRLRRRKPGSGSLGERT